MATLNKDNSNISPNVSTALTEKEKKAMSSNSVDDIMKYFCSDPLAAVDFNRSKKIEERPTNKEIEGLIADSSKHFAQANNLLIEIKDEANKVKDSVEIFCGEILDKIKNIDGKSPGDIIQKRDIGVMIKHLVSARISSMAISNKIIKNFEKEINSLKTKHNKICGFKLDNHI